MARNCWTSVRVDVVFLNAMTTVSHEKKSIVKHEKVRMHLEHIKCPPGSNVWQE